MAGVAWAPSWASLTIALAGSSLALDSSPGLPLTHALGCLLQSFVAVRQSPKTTLDSGHVVPVGARCATLFGTVRRLPLSLLALDYHA